MKSAAAHPKLGKSSRGCASSCLGELTGSLLLVLLGAFVFVAFYTAGSARYSPPPGCQVSLRFPRSVLKWCDLISNYAGQAGISPDLVAAVIWMESGGNPAAFSHSGAVGLMQVMPRDGPAAYFQCAKGPCFQDRPTMEELRDPEFNIQYGTRLLSEYLGNKGGDLREALRLYGPMDVGYSYADNVLALVARYGSQPTSP